MSFNLLLYRGIQPGSWLYFWAFYTVFFDIANTNKCSVTIQSDTACIRVTKWNRTENFGPVFVCFRAVSWQLMWHNPRKWQLIWNRPVRYCPENAPFFVQKVTIDLKQPRKRHKKDHQSYHKPEFLCHIIWHVFGNQSVSHQLAGNSRCFEVSVAVWIVTKFAKSSLFLSFCRILNCQLRGHGPRYLSNPAERLKSESEFKSQTEKRVCNVPCPFVMHEVFLQGVSRLSGKQHTTSRDIQSYGCRTCNHEAFR